MPLVDVYNISIDFPDIYVKMQIERGVYRVEGKSLPCVKHEGTIKTP